MSVSTAESHIEAINNFFDDTEKPPEIPQPEPQKSNSESPEKDSDPSFFEILESQKLSRRENPSNWVKIHGIWVEKSYLEAKNELESVESSAPKSKYDEVESLFAANNPNIYNSMEFEHTYKFDWALYSQDAFQYVVFTKICQNHSDGLFVEMKKEDRTCTNCGSSNLTTTARLTIPLDLSEIPIPSFENTQIHVSFLAEKLLEQSGLESLELLEKSVDFSKTKCRKMFDLYRKMMAERRTIGEYKEWFDKCKQFVKNTVHSKSLHLHHGHVVRRKIENSGVESKKRCLIFAHIFDLKE
ncbi:hypothetical protein GCK72_008280 [Caenorhabditis remanei]|uniref:Uncharacterized protein n=1 Tax=Caenorhabditis remanei TaxID=31234 RepID=A0A6A5GZT0_CAERE|nr:hypothetical protein GCK72_008280 [Caenorhabditis remanei]KAF1760034.1 hypothetical protein GCK72_008280 [Caenorhabditis remanei]